jgi:hypothetical protein
MKMAPLIACPHRHRELGMIRFFVVTHAERHRKWVKQRATLVFAPKLKIERVL